MREADLGFKVFKLSSSNFKVWDTSSAPKDAAGLAEQLSLMAHNVIAGRPDDALLYELLTEMGMGNSLALSDEAILSNVRKIQADIRRKKYELFMTQAECVFGQERAAQTIRVPEYKAPIPDLLGYLQRETELTRSTLAEILRKSDRLRVDASTAATLLLVSSS